MAIYDGLAKQAGLPLYQYLGGYRDQLETDYTVSKPSARNGRGCEATCRKAFILKDKKVGKR